MSPHGAGSQRIVVIGGSPAQPPQATTQPVAQPHPPREAHPPREPSAKTHSMQQHGWTTRRLTIFGSAGAAATVLGGILFLSRFGVFGANDSPFMAMGFGLFVIGMIVFCACLIALLGMGISAVAERSGWGAAAMAVLAPLALAWAIYGLGAVGYAVPAVLSLVLIGGLVVALK
jgi:hypothetical protein